MGNSQTAMSIEISMITLESDVRNPPKNLATSYIYEYIQTSSAFRNMHESIHWFVNSALIS